MLLLMSLMVCACSRDANLTNTQIYLGDKTKHVFVIVMDGARYSETFGDSTHRYVPQLYSYFTQYGVIASAFKNKGQTLTNASHAAMCAGVYQSIDNGGNTLPAQPSAFQYWLQTYNRDPSKAWVITSKDKLHVLGNTTDATYQNKYLPRLNCGPNGINSGYRDDTTTLRVAKEILVLHQPELVLLQFKEPDPAGHSGNLNHYLNSIITTDSLIVNFIKYTESLPAYAGSTSYLITNDHGRHTDDFVSHGDACEGCQHIMLLAAGPDFASHKSIGTAYETPDIAATVASLLHFQMPTCQGNVMLDLFKK